MGHSFYGVRVRGGDRLTCSVLWCSLVTSVGCSTNPTYTVTGTGLLRSKRSVLCRGVNLSQIFTSFTVYSEIRSKLLVTSKVKIFTEVKPN